MKQFALLTDLPNDPDFHGKIKEEMSKRYLYSILKVTYKEKTSLLSYLGSDGAVFVFTDEDKLTQLNIPASDETAIVQVPKVACGYYQSYDKKKNLTLFYFEHTPYRQWKRGINPENSCLYKNSDLVLKRGANNYLKYNFSALENTGTCQLQDGCLIAKELGEALINREFAVTLPPVKNTPFDFWLWYKTKLVGGIQQKQKTIQVVNTVFLQEVLDYFYENSNFKIEVYNEC